MDRSQSHKSLPGSEKSAKSEKEKRDESTVNVVVRLRPPANPDEDVKETYTTDATNVTVRDPLSRGRMEHSFTFNQVFKPADGQEVIFGAVAKPLVDHLLNGFNSCCFAYGQTGSGKTHSVFGEGNAEQRGLLARSIEYMFDRIESQSDQKEVGMVVSFLEIYLDQVRDLGRFYLEKDEEKLDKVDSRSRPNSASSMGRPPMKNSLSARSLIGSRPSSAHSKASNGASGGSRPSSANKDRSGSNSMVEASDPYPQQDLEIHESPQGLVYVEGLALIPVTNIREVLDVANLGVRMRATYETRLNARSSRSHTIFSVSIVQKSRKNTKNGVVGSVVNFVDLAGSERLAKSQSEGRRFQEAVIINSSLSALGKVVLALASDRPRHIPYRDSKLTRILQNSLGGNSYTTLLTAIDPSAANYEESLNSLFFADRCQNVQNKPVQGLVENGDEAHEKTLARLSMEVANLKHQLEIQTALATASGLAGAATTQKLLGSAGQPGLQAGGLGQPGLGSASAAGGVLSAAGAASSVDEAGAARIGAGEVSVAMSQGGVGLGSIMDQAVEMLDEERSAAVAAGFKVQEFTDLVQKGRVDQLHRDDILRREANGIRRDMKEIALEISKCQTQLKQLNIMKGMDRAEFLAALQENLEEVKQERQTMARTFSRPLLQAGKHGEDGADEVACRNVEAKVEHLERQNRWATHAVQDGHESDCATLAKLHKQWSNERDEDARGAEETMEQYQKQCEAKRRQVHGELVSVYDLLSQLFRVLNALETGVPNWHRTGLRVPGDPGPPQPTIPVVGSPRMKRSSSVAPPEGSSADGADWPPSSLAALLSGLPEPPLRREAAEIKRTLNRADPPSSAVRPSSASRARSRTGSREVSDITQGAVGAGEASCSWWDADRFASDFCDLSGSQSSGQEGRAALQRLEAPRLRALCRALCRRASLSESEKAAERNLLSEQVARDLSQDDRISNIRNLEKEIVSYREKIADQEEQIRQLELALRHCSSSLGQGTFPLKR